MSTRRIIPLDQVEPDQQHLTQNCSFCYCPKQPKKPKTKAVMAVEVEVGTPCHSRLYIGICGNHAEVYPLTEEEEEKHPMWCPDCFPRNSHHASPVE
jgi:hypothetical protein